MPDCAAANFRTCAWRTGIQRNNVWRCARAKTTRTGQSLCPLRPQQPWRPTWSCGSRCPGPALLVYQGQPLGADFIRNHLHHYADLAGLKGVTPHRLRHTCAIRLLNAGMPVTSVQALLGHESLRTTRGYAQLYDDTVRKDYQVAVAWLQGQSPTEESEPTVSPAPLVESAVSLPAPLTGSTAAVAVVIGIACVNVLSFATAANCM